MFHKFLSKYGLGTHLALLAAAPLALTPFLDAAKLASVVLWLSALAVVWLFTEPSVRKGEHLSLARYRVRKQMLRDPFFWFLCIAVLFAAFRWMNTGIELRYDPEQTIWLVGDSKLGGGPSAVDGAGFLPFALLLALCIVAMGLRHGIGLMARAEFGVMGSLIAGIGGLAAVGCACAQLEPFSQWMTSGFGSAPFWASSFGVWLVLGIVSGIQLEARHWKVARWPFIIGIAGTSSAIVFFAQPLLASAWFALTLLILIFSLVYLGRAGSGGAIARSLSLAFIGFMVPALLMMSFVPDVVREAKLSGFDPIVAMPEAHMQASEVLSRISRQMCLANPWFGVGNGAYGLHVPFLAEKTDWSLIPAQVKFAFNGYWTILAERGFLGCLLPVVGLGMLLVTYFRRMVGAYFYLRHKDDADVFVFAVPPVAWCSLFVVLLIAGEAVISPIFLTDTLFVTVLSVMSLSAAAFPKSKASLESDAESTKSLEN